MMNSLKRHIVSESTLISNSSSALPGLNKYEHARRKAEYANYPDHNGSIKITSAVVDGRLGEPANFNREGSGHLLFCL